jgi:hypothetical protein
LIYWSDLGDPIHFVSNKFIGEPSCWAVNYWSHLLLNFRTKCWGRPAVMGKSKILTWLEKVT